MMKRPYFTLHLEVMGCMGYFEVNGAIQELNVPDEAFFMGTPIKLDLPVNHWIREGDNEMLMLLAPLGEPEFPPMARCRMTLQVRESGGASEDRQDIAALEFSGERAAQGTGAEGSTPAARLRSSEGFAAHPEGDVTVGEVQRETYGGVAAVVSRVVTLPPLNLPTWAFFGGEDITGLSGVDLSGRVDDATGDRLQAELLPMYRQIWQAFSAGKTEDVLPLFDERNREIDAAFFHEPGTTGKRLAERFAEAVADEQRNLWPIADDNVLLEIHDNDKLVRLTQNNRKPLLSFDFEGGGAEYFDVMFRKSGGQWVITR